MLIDLNLGLLTIQIKYFYSTFFSHTLSNAGLRLCVDTDATSGFNAAKVIITRLRLCIISRSFRINLKFCVMRVWTLLWMSIVLDFRYSRSGLLYHFLKIIYYHSEYCVLWTPQLQCKSNTTWKRNRIRTHYPNWLVVHAELKIQTDGMPLSNVLCT